MKILKNTYFQYFLKILIVFTALYFVYSRIENTQNLKIHFKPTELLILLLFSFLNWFIDVLKWKNLANLLQKTTLKNAITQILISHTLSFITPNKIGEYGAKSLFFKSKKQALGLTFVGNTYQLFTTILFGCIGLLIMNKYYSLPWIDFKLIIALLFIFLLTFKLFKNKFLKFLKKRKFYKKIPFNDHLKTIIFSILKYCIFSNQFYYLLIVFEVSITYTTAIPIIFSTYLLASIIPSLSLFDFLIKGSAAVYLFQFVGIPAIVIVSITFTSWFLNFAIPAIIGGIYVLRFNPKKSYDSI